MQPPAIRPTITLFLYGTLRPGGTQHGLLAPFVVGAGPARVWGRLYHVPAGYPALEVPEDLILARGTVDPDADAIASAGRAGAVARYPSDYQWVHGDWVELRDPSECVPRLDDYEDFHPKARSLYDRVLIPIDAPNRIQTAWVYIKSPSPEDIHIPGGVWDPASFRPA